MTDADDSDPDADAEEKRFEGTFCDASAAQIEMGHSACVHEF